ncbi:MAG: hypothetical protein ABMB14_37160, partial [Myxococcota bacterium]
PADPPWQVAALGAVDAGTPGVIAAALVELARRSVVRLEQRVPNGRPHVVRCPPSSPPAAVDDYERALLEALFPRGEAEVGLVIGVMPPRRRAAVAATGRRAMIERGWESAWPSPRSRRVRATLVAIAVSLIAGSAAVVLDPGAPILATMILAPGAIAMGLIPLAMQTDALSPTGRSARERWAAVAASVAASGPPDGAFDTWAPYAVAWSLATGWPTDRIPGLVGPGTPFELDAVLGALAHALAPPRDARRPGLLELVRDALRA